MRNYNFIKHTGTISPVAEDVLVVYRTTSTATPISHVHHAVPAGDVNWTDDEMYMGRVLEYARYIPLFRGAPDEYPSGLLHANS